MKIWRGIYSVIIKHKYGEYFMGVKNQSNESAWYVFKLADNIALEAEVSFSRIELEGLFPDAKIEKIRNFIDILVSYPLREFLSHEFSGVRIQDIITRRLPYGNIQGFYFKDDKLRNLTTAIRRLAYTREIFIIVNTEKDKNEIIKKVYPDAKENVDCQIFTLKNHNKYLHFIRIVPHLQYLETSNSISLCSFANTWQRVAERIRENVERVISHFMHGTYYIPLLPSTRVYKEIEDFIEERKEETLYLTHSYGPPYKGKFHPRLVRAFINYSGLQNGLVFDPFVGSGTTSIESTLMGLDSVGIDINPLCILCTNAKITALHMNADLLRKSIDDFLKRAKYVVKPNIGEKGSRSLLEFSELKIKKRANRELLNKLKSVFGSNVAEIEDIVNIKYLIDDFFDPELKDFFLCALAKVISKLVKKKTKPDVLKMLSEELQDMLKIVLIFEEFKEKLGIKLGESRNYVADARSIPPSVLGEEEVDVIITSPSYSTAIDYVKNDLPQLVALELVDPENLEKNMIGNPRVKVSEREKIIMNREIRESMGRFELLPESARKVIKLIAKHRSGLALRQYKYLIDMYECLKEMYRVLKSNGKCMIVIGNNTFKVDNKEVIFRNDDYLWEMAQNIGFKPIKRIPREFRKSDYGNIKVEEILVLKK